MHQLQQARLDAPHSHQPPSSSKPRRARPAANALPSPLKDTMDTISRTRDAPGGLKAVETRPKQPLDGEGEERAFGSRVVTQAEEEVPHGEDNKLRVVIRSRAPRPRTRPPHHHAHRASTASLAESESLSPPPAYEAAISLSSSSRSAQTAHRRSASSSSSLSDPTSDSEDPLNDLLRLTSSLLAAGSGILASGAQLQGAVNRVLAPPPSGAVEGAEEEEGVEGEMRRALARADDALGAKLDVLGRDVERFTLRRQGRDPTFLLCGREDRAERGRTVYVTAEPEGGRRAGLGSLTEGGGGGMKRSTSKAQESLAKLAAGTSGSGSGSASMAASSSKVTLDEPTAPSPPPVRRPLRRAGPSLSLLPLRDVEEDLASLSTPSSSRPILAHSASTAFSSSTSSPPLSSTPPLSISRSDSLSSLSPSTPLASPSLSSTPSPISFASLTSPSPSPAPSPSTPVVRKHRRTPHSASLSKPAPLATSLSFSSSLADVLDGPADASFDSVGSLPSPTKTSASAAAERLKALGLAPPPPTGGDESRGRASRAGGGEEEPGGTSASGGGSWWSWT